MKTAEPKALADLTGYHLNVKTTMNDQEFLIWLHEWLEHQHGESRYVDYMHKLRAIILATDPNQKTPNTSMANSIEDVRKILSDNATAHLRAAKKENV